MRWHLRFFKYGTSAARKPIDYLEGDVVVRACKSEGHKWHMQLVDFGVDNMAFERSAETGRSRAPRLNELCKALFYLQVKHAFILQMFWLSTHDNFLADHLSRDRHEEFLRFRRGWHESPRHRPSGRRLRRP